MTRCEVREVDPLNITLRRTSFSSFAYQMSRDTRELRINRVFTKALRPTASLSPDYASILELTDEINQRPEKACNIARRMIENVFKFNTSSINIYLNTLILEACVLNCGSRFHTEIAKKEFVKSLLYRHKKSVRRKEFPPLRSYEVPPDYIPTNEMELQNLTLAKIFILIQRMSKTYSTSSFYQAWHLTYGKLLAKGAHMPSFHQSDVLPPYITRPSPSQYRHPPPTHAPLQQPSVVRETPPLVVRPVHEVSSAVSRPSEAAADSVPPVHSAPSGEELLETVLLHQTIDGCKRESSRVERLLRSNIGDQNAKEDLRRAYDQLQTVLHRLERNSVSESASQASPRLATSASSSGGSRREYNPFDTLSANALANAQEPSLTQRVDEPVRQNLRTDPFVGWLFQSPGSNRRSLPLTGSQPVCANNQKSQHRSVSFNLSEELDP